MRKWIALLLALTLLCLCGCVTNDNKPDDVPTAPVQTEAPEETTVPDMQMVGLTVWVVSEGLWADTEAVDALLAEFNAYYPNILVNVEYHAAEDMGSNCPDIVLADAEQINAWYAQGGMADLSDLWAKGLPQDVYEAVQPGCAGETGEYHTVPLCMVAYCMAVNQSALEEAEVLSSLNTTSHTWNTASFLKVAETLHDYGMDTVMSVYCKDQQEDALTRLLVTNLYDGTFVEKKTETYNVAEGEMGKALKALAQLAGIRFDPAVGAQAAREQFLNGDTAFVLNWSSRLQMDHAANKNILFMHYPSADSRPETYGDVYGFGVFDNGNSTKVAASKTFVAFMSGNAAAVRATGNLPARESMKDAYVGTELERTVSELNKLLSFLEEKEPTGRYWDTARKEWVNLLQTIGRGGDCQSALEEAQKKLNALFPELFPPETEATEATE